MRLALAALVFTFPATSAAEGPAPRPAAKVAAPARICPDDMRMRNARSPEPVRLKRLGELPPGDLTLTVVNQVGGCIEPVVVQQGIGAFGR
jgi:hypothetical protein